MSFLDTNLKKILNQSQQYLQKKFQIHSRNIAHGDTPGAKRKSISDFNTILNRQKNQTTSKDSGSLKLGNTLKMAKKDVFDTKQEIRREYEIAQANLTISRHKAVIALSKKFSSMMSAALKMV